MEKNGIKPHFCIKDDITGAAPNSVIFKITPNITFKGD